MEYLSGLDVSKQIKEELINKIKNKKRSPKLVILLNEDDLSSKKYASNILKNCLVVGIECEIISIKEEKEYILNLELVNQNPLVDALLITRPLKAKNENEIISLLDNKKDVDGLNSYMLGQLVINKPLIVPSTSLAIIKMLDYYHIDLEGKKVLIVGRSISVGKPAALLCLNKNATITVAHSKTRSLQLEEYDIVIACIGKPHYLKGTMMKKDAIVIDAGIHYLPDKIIGDVEPSENIKYISKVPGGIGAITTACLLENVLKCYEVNTNDK